MWEKFINHFKNKDTWINLGLSLLSVPIIIAILNYVHLYYFPFDIIAVIAVTDFWCDYDWRKFFRGKG